MATPYLVNRTGGLRFARFASLDFEKVRPKLLGLRSFVSASGLAWHGMRSSFMFALALALVAPCTFAQKLPAPSPAPRTLIFRSPFY
jgi:hypothetical protein